MNIEAIYTYCLSKRGAEETLPFNETTIVMKVGGKMFALLPTDVEDHSINLKCNPERSVELRDEYECIIPGYHMNKKHWNTVYFSRGEVSQSLVLELIDHSYDLVFGSLPARVRKEIEAIEED